ncbi:MAG: hypothetical protein ACOYMG_23850 [Candidatus Methylumidiphilus sp.]
MFFPFLAATIAATSAFKLGAMSVKIAVLSGMLYAVLAIAILIGLYALSMQHRA